MDDLYGTGGAAAFSGHVDHALDVKGRLIVPARFREILGPRFVLSIALGDPCLVLLTQDVYLARCRQLQASPKKDARFWQFYREINRLTESRAECDNQGRLLIPPDLRKYAGIVRDVASIGNGMRVEIWAAEKLAPVDASSEDAAAFGAELGFF